MISMFLVWLSVVILVDYFVGRVKN